MLRKTGSGVSVNGAASAGAALTAAEERLRARPWEATGCVAVDVLVTWALVAQKAGNPAAGLHELEARASGFAWQERTMLAQVEQMEALGCKIDKSGAGRAMVHPAAEAVAAAVELSPGGERIARCARDGAPGGWWEPERWLVPERWEIEGVSAMWCYAERRLGKHCPLVATTTAAAVERARGEYVGWWDDLCDLAWGLQQRALGFAVARPGVRREPWAVGA